MSKVIEGSGQYTAKDTGEAVTYSFEYRQFDSFDDLVKSVGEAEVLKNGQRMEKLDANNVAREKAKIKNGHSTRKLMTEEEKAQAKAQRAENKGLLDMLKAKGVSSLEDLKAIL